MGTGIAQAIVVGAKVGNAVKGLARNVSRIESKAQKWSVLNSLKKLVLKRLANN